MSKAMMLSNMLREERADVARRDARIRSLERELEAVQAERDALARRLLVLEAVVDAACCKSYPADLPRWWAQHNGVIQRAHTINIIVRKDGKFYAVEGDFIKPLAKAIVEAADGL